MTLPFDLGFKAGEELKSEWYNPYPEGTNKHIRWEEGRIAALYGFEAISDFFPVKVKDKGSKYYGYLTNSPDDYL